MGCHGNDGIFITKEHIFLRTMCFCILSGPCEKIHIHNEMPYVFNVCLITLVSAWVVSA